MRDSEYPTWQQIDTEYKQARFQLEQLLKEGGTIQSQTEQLILNLDEHYIRLKNRIENSVQLRYSLTSPLPAPINRKIVKGMVAYRAWKMKVKGALSPSITWSEDAWSKEVAFADQPPSRNNHNGLHATRIEYWKKNTYGDFVSGLIDCYGKVVEHEDGVIRAECARILMILLTITDESQTMLLMTGALDLLKYRYPCTPVYMVSPYQKELIMWREVLVNYGAI